MKKIVISMVFLFTVYAVFAQGWLYLTRRVPDQL